MITRTRILDERCLEIYETDIVNGGEVLILMVYCVRRNNGVWALNEPQIYNEKIYEANKDMYNTQIQAFRNDCIGEVKEDLSLLVSQMESLKKDNSVIMNAIAELDTEINK